jgi:hypothetical protein
MTTSPTRVVNPKDLASGLFAFLSDQVHIINTSSSALRELHTETVEEINRIQKIIDENNFFPVENGQQEYKKLLPPLKHKEERLRMAIFGYSRWINLEFLSWPQEKTNLPAFMVLDQSRL